MLRLRASGDMRYERKYRIPGDDFAAVRAVVDTHPLSFRKQYADRQVNNIYLDSPDLSCYRDNLIGAMNREKFRIRWYGNLLNKTESPVLELKRKDGELGDKFSLKMDGFELGSLHGVEAEIKRQFLELGRNTEDASLDNSLSLPAHHQPFTSKDLLPEINSLKGQLEQAKLPAPSVITPAMLNSKVRMPMLRPVLLNSYLRSYYISGDHRFRLTIDREMKFGGMDLRMPIASSMRYDRAVVIEVKYDFQHDDDYDRVGQFLPFRAGKNSKYVTGMLLVGRV